MSRVVLTLFESRITHALNMAWPLPVVGGVHGGDLLAHRPDEEDEVENDEYLGDCVWCFRLGL